MSRRVLLVLGILAVTSLTWAATPSPAVKTANELLPECNCNENADCQSGFCGFRNCSISNGYFQVCD